MAEAKTMFAISMETQMLVDALRKASDSISYEELSTVINSDVRKEAAGHLHTARRIVQREDLTLWGTVRKQGLQKLAGSGVIVAGRHSVTKIHREAKRGAEKLACVKYEELPNEDRIKHNATAAALGALFSMTKTSSIRKLESAAAKTPDKLAIGDTLKVFGA